VLSEGAPTNAIDKIQQGSCTGCSQIFILIDPAKLGGEKFTGKLAARRNVHLGLERT